MPYSHLPLQVYEMRCNWCNKHFYEIVDHYFEECPHCGEKIVDELSTDEIELHEHWVIVDYKNGIVHVSEQKK
jgi:ribosomal silencing factor RsfS